MVFAVEHLNHYDLQNSVEARKDWLIKVSFFSVSQICNSPLITGKREPSFSGKMDPDAVKSTLQNLAFGNVMAAAARNYQKELLAEGKAPATTSADQEVDLDELMDVSSIHSSATFNCNFNFSKAIIFFFGD